MAIQNRRGAKKDFDATKMLPGEIAVTTDGTREVYAVFAPGDAKELASKEDVQGIVDEFNSSMEENIQKATDEIEKEAIEQTGNITKKAEEVLNDIPNYEERLAELETYKANSILCKTSGTTILTTDSAKVKPNIKTFGKSTQKTYEGNQLLDVSNIGDEYVTHNITVGRDGEYITLEGTTETSYLAIDIPCEIPSGTTVYLYISEGDISNMTFYLRDADLNNIGGIQNGKSATISSDAAYFRIVLTTATYDTKLKIMLSDKENAEWEPFVGNAPSPSLEYKQEVTPIGEGGSVVEKVLSGNIYNSSFQKTVITIGGSTTENNGIYSTTASKTDVYVNNQADKGSAYQSNRFGWLMSIPDEVSEIGITITNEQFNKNFISFFDKDKISLGFQYFSESVLSLGRTKMPKKTKYISLRFGKGDAVVGQTYETSVMVNYGEALPYEPYSEQPLTLQTPNGLHGIPLGQTIPDAIKNSPIHMSGVYWDVVEQRYYIGDTRNENGKDVQRVVEYGIEDFRNIHVAQDSNWYDSEKSYSYEIKNPFKGLLLDGIIKGGLCTHFFPYSFTKFYLKGIENGFMCSQNYLVVNISKSLGICKTVDEFRQYCIDNDVKFYKILRDPIVTDTSEEELAQYNAVHMNYPNTTIVNDAGAYMEVEYVADTKEHIKQNYVSKAMHEEHESRIAELEKAIVNS